MKSIVAFTYAALLLVITLPCFPQTLVVDKTYEKAEPETHTRTWNISAELAVQNQLEARNKTPLIEHPLATTRLRYTTGSTTRNGWLQTSVGYTNRNVNNDRWFGFEAGFAQALKKRTEFTIDSVLHFTREVKFGSIGGEVSYRFGSKENNLKPFARMDRYFALDTGHHTPKPGTTFSGGLKILKQLGKFELENSSEVIINRKSVTGENFAIGSIDLGLFYSVSNNPRHTWKIGPRFDYWRRINGHTDKKHSVGFGFTIKYN